MTTVNDTTHTTDIKRRRFLVAVTAAVGTVGAIGAAVPFIKSWSPSAKARAAGAPVKVNVSKIEPGQLVTVAWRGQPVWVAYRTPEMLSVLKQSSLIDLLRDPESAVATQQPAYAVNEYRSIKPEYLVAVGICTHLGCVPSYRPDGITSELSAYQGFFCPCHGSKFDMAGRVFKKVPAPTNLVIPPHHYLGDSVVEIGMDADGMA